MNPLLLPSMTYMIVNLLALLIFFAYHLSKAPAHRLANPEGGRPD